MAITYRKLTLFFVVLLPALATSYNADIPYGARLSVPSSEAVVTNKSVPEKNIKFKRAPATVHYELSDADFSNAATRDSFIFESGHSPSSVNETSAAVAPSETMGNMMVTPIFQSEPESVLLNIAAQQHPGIVQSHRQPLMVDSSNVQRYHLPPLTAALPMHEFEAFAMSLLEPRSTSSVVPSSTHVTEPKVTIHYDPNGYLLREELPHGTRSLTHHSSHASSEARVHIAHQNNYIPGIPGKAWKDYPMFSSVPPTTFNCNLASYGYYADVETGCQAWHYCQPDGRHNSFLCPNGTVFNQKARVCDWWFHVHCPSSIRLYGLNADLYQQQPKPYLSHTDRAASLPQTIHRFRDVYKHRSALRHRPLYESTRPELESSA